MTVQTSIVVLNWNGREDTMECLRSIQRLNATAASIVVVDNGSTDGSIEAIRHFVPAVTLLENRRNLGYAEGNNVGIRYALAHGAEFVLLLNNDTIVEPAFLERLVGVACANPKAAVVGPYIYYVDRPDTIWFAGAIWEEEELAFTWPGQGQRLADASHLPLETAYVCGAAMLLRASVLREIGLLDERFFLVYEESDWCFRARRAGHTCLMVPEARIWHKVGASFGTEQSPLRAYFSTRNKLLWSRSNLPRRQHHRLVRQTLRRHMPHFVLTQESLTLAKRLAWGAVQYARDWERLFANPVQSASRLGLRDYFLERFGDCPDPVRVLNARWVESRRAADMASVATTATRC